MFVNVNIDIKSRKSITHSLVYAVIASTLGMSMTAVQAAGPTTISVPTTVPPVLLSSTSGNIEITPSGNLTGAGDAIDMDAATATVTIDANNASPSAPNAISTSGVGIHILAAGSNATVTIGAGSTVQSTGSNAISVDTTTGANITNNGSIVATAIGQTSLGILNSLNTSVTNNGTITSPAGEAFSVTGGSGTTITNSGTFSSPATAIGISNTALGSLTNSTTGTISATAGGRAVVVTSSVTAGTIMNSGSITAMTNNALLISGTLTGVTNTSTGIISTTNADAVLINAAGGNIINGFTNAGTIKTGTAGNNAINFAASTKSVDFINTGGTVTGNVLLSQTAVPFDQVLNMTGGTITGLVTAAGNTNAATLTVTGGTLPGGIKLSTNEADVINQSGGVIGNITGTAGQAQVLNIIGPSTITTGGSITTVDFINVQNMANFNVNNPITTTRTITVQSGGTLNNSSSITGVSVNVNINANGVFDAKTAGIANLGSGGLMNNGTLILEPEPLGVFNITTTNNFSQHAGAILQTDIQNPQNFGKLNVNTAAVDNSSVQVVLTGTGYNPNGSTYQVMTSTASTGINPDTITLIQPTSQTLTFAIVPADSPDLVLKVTRTPFSTVANPANQSVASALDTILSTTPTDVDFLEVIGALDAQGNVNPGLSALLPQSDGGLQQMSHDIQRNIFEGLGHYLDEHLGIAALIPGYSAGDPGMGRSSGIGYSRGNWAKVFGNHVTQKTHNSNPGYTIDSFGVLAGYDQYYTDRLVAGGALAYAKGDVISKSISKPEQNVKSFQLIAYSTYDCEGPGYLDMMGAIGLNTYVSNKHIVIGPVDLTARGAFDGWQYGLNFEYGYRLSYGQYRIIPVVKLRYAYLELDNYTETGAGGVGQTIHNGNNEEAVTTLGFKFNSTYFYQQATYVPEFRFNLIYDWIAAASLVSATFEAGGPAFVVPGVKPQHCTYNFSAGLTIFAQENIVFVINYDLDLRKAYIANTASMKFRFEW